MDDLLTQIKRAVFAGDYWLTEKAATELECDDLTEQDLVESIVLAVAMHKTIRSTSSPRRRELLHVIISPNLRGTVIYSKGKLVAKPGERRTYVLISAKQAL